MRLYYTTHDEKYTYCVDITLYNTIEDMIKYNTTGSLLDVCYEDYLYNHIGFNEDHEHFITVYQDEARSQVIVKGRCFVEFEPIFNHKIVR